MTGVILHNVTFRNDGVVLEYASTADVRDNGLAINKILFVPTGDDYEDEIEAVRGAALALLVDALEDFENLPVWDGPIDPREAEEVDDDDDEDSQG